jgi:hypothetical protein
MRSNGMRVVAGIAVVAVAVVLLLVLKDDGESGDGSTGGSGNASVRSEGAGQGKGATAAAPTIAIKGGEPVVAVRTLTYIEGDQIRFAVESDTADEVHVHGYDLMKDVEAGGTVRFDFPATIEGGFEVELEESKVQIAELTVNP